jgi:hypothetical protein
MQLIVFHVSWPQYDIERTQINYLFWILFLAPSWLAGLAMTLCGVGKSSIQISAGTLNILTKIFRGISQSFKAMPV